MDKPTGRRNKLRRSLLFWLIVLALILVWWFWPSTNKPNLGFGMRAQSTPVAVTAVESGSINRSIQALGTVTAVNTVTIRPRVEGTLLKLNFTDGQFVQQGDLLALIDPEPFQIKLDQALGQQIQHNAQLALAQQDLARYEKLYKQNSVARQQLDDARAKLTELQGQAKIDAAAVADAKLQLGYTRITAPATGRLGIRKIDEGNLIRAGDTDGLVVLTQNDPIDVVFAITQSNLPRVLSSDQQLAHLPVQIFDQVNNQVIATGNLYAIDNQIDTSTGSVQLKARFTNQDQSLFPNQFVQVRLLLGEEQGLIVPLQAIQRGSRGEYVYKVNPDNKVTMVNVLSLVDDGENAVVEADLAIGEKLVITGIDRLRENSLVEIIEPDSGD